MNKQQEALKLALEALKELRMLGMNAQWHDSWLAKPNEAITAIREALAEQPAQQQEPVAWMFQHDETGRTMCVDVQQVEWGFEKGNPRLKKIAPLYTSPPAQRKPLTDDEIVKITADPCLYIRGGDYRIDIARAIEAAHGIKGDA